MNKWNTTIVWKIISPSKWSEIFVILSEEMLAKSAGSAVGTRRVIGT